VAALSLFPDMDELTAAAVAGLQADERVTLSPEDIEKVAAVLAEAYRDALNAMYAALGLPWLPLVEPETEGSR
jgi:hypothetical protein